MKDYPAAVEFRYEENIISSPRTHFGTWTPEGWRVHEIRRSRTMRESITLSGDGVTAEFSGLPMDFSEDVHDEEDELSDAGIYPSTPRVEYPPENPRWAVSHTLLAYPVADQTLYDQEYTWDRDAGEMQTYFRRHVVIEKATTDSENGLTVNVKNPRISSVVVGNRSYPLCNSAVRGVWDNPAKQGRNYYSQRQVQRCLTHNGVYILLAHSPVIQCQGIWKWEDGDEAAFDYSGNCFNEETLIQAGVPLDCPKLGAAGYTLKCVHSPFYGGSVEVGDGARVVIDARMLAALRACRNVPFEKNGVGFAAWKHWDHACHIWGVPGYYAVAWDFNDNGTVDVSDEETLQANFGRKVRMNYYSAAYFGNDWLSSGILLNPEMQSEPVICLWSRGAGYDAATGRVNLFGTPGPSRKVYIEYHYDEPAAAGRDNIAVIVHRPDYLIA